MKPSVRGDGRKAGGADEHTGDASVATDGRLKRSSSAIAVERAIDVLAYLAEHGEAAVTELADALGSGTTAIHRILTALRVKGVVEQDPDSERYRLGYAILALARPTRGGADLREVAAPHLRAIAEGTGETVSLGIRRGFDRLCIDQIESTREVRWVGHVGQWSPLYAGATGRAMLAAMNDYDVNRYIDTVKRYAFTTATLTEASALRNDIEATRNRGYAVADGDRIEGLRGLSVPILDRTGDVVAAITVGGPSTRAPADIGKWADILRTSALEISRVLGYRGDPFGG